MNSDTGIRVYRNESVLADLSIIFYFKASKPISDNLDSVGYLTYLLDLD